MWRASRFGTNKKSQITLFIILGIVLLLVIAVIIIIYNKVFTEPPTSPGEPAEMAADTLSVKNFVEACLKEVVTPGIFLLGLQGGYIYLPSRYLETDGNYIAYSYFSGENTAPSSAYVGSQISTYVEEALPACTKGFDTFFEQGIAVAEERPDATTIIGRDSIQIKIIYPITLTKQGVSATISDFVYVVPVRLGYILNISSEISERQANDSDWLDLTFMSGFDVTVDIVPINSTDYVTVITDPKSIIQQNTYKYLYANKIRKNKAPQIFVNDTLYLPSKELFNYTIQYSGEGVVFSDDTSLFDISPAGHIEFIPRITGKYPVTIRATDRHRKYDSKTIMFIIK